MRGTADIAAKPCLGIIPTRKCLDVFQLRRIMTMANVWLPTTSPTLLARLRHDPSNEAAWDEFVENYGRHIYRWCRQWRLQEADSEDVTQEILLKLARKLRDFAY